MVKVKPSRIYAATLNEHRRRIARLAERHGVAQLKGMYDRAQTEIERKLHHAARALGDKFTAHQHRVFLSQIRQGQALVAHKMTGALGDISKQAQVESLRGMITDLTRLEKHFTGADVVLPVEEASKFQGVIDGRRQSLLRAHKASMENYGAVVVGKAEDSLALSLMTGENTSEAIDRVMDTTSGLWWQGERIVRTETLWAFNSTYYDGLKETADELGNLYTRWVEYVDDDTYAPLDDRVDDDSIAMHGQVVLPGGTFKFPDDMPDGGPVPAKILERMRRDFPGGWSFPPNRPNDRATLSSWRPHWGVPAWRLVGGERVDMETEPVLPIGE